jgi:hypothetical protein
MNCLTKTNPIQTQFMVSRVEPLDCVASGEGFQRSGFWHYWQFKGQPLKKTLVRIPGPSWTAYLLIPNTNPEIFSSARPAWFEDTEFESGVFSVSVKIRAFLSFSHFLFAQITKSQNIKV